VDRDEVLQVLRWDQEVEVVEMAPGGAVEWRQGPKTRVHGCAVYRDAEMRVLRWDQEVEAEAPNNAQMCPIGLTGTEELTRFVLAAEHGVRELVEALALPRVEVREYVQVEDLVLSSGVVKD